MKTGVHSFRGGWAIKPQIGFLTGLADCEASCLLSDDLQLPMLHYSVREKETSECVLLNIGTPSPMKEFEGTSD